MTTTDPRTDAVEYHPGPSTPAHPAVADAPVGPDVDLALRLRRAEARERLARQHANQADIDRAESDAHAAAMEAEVRRLTAVNLRLQLGQDRTAAHGPDCDEQDQAPVGYGVIARVRDTVSLLHDVGTLAGARRLADLCNAEAVRHGIPAVHEVCALTPVDPTDGMAPTTRPASTLSAEEGSARGSGRVEGAQGDSGGLPDWERELLERQVIVERRPPLLAPVDEEEDGPSLPSMGRTVAPYRAEAIGRHPDMPITRTLSAALAGDIRGTIAAITALDGPTLNRLVAAVRAVAKAGEAEVIRRTGEADRG